MATPDERLWRRYLHFSLRSLLILVLGIGCLLGWVTRSARVQREAVAAIEKAGGWTAYEWQWRDGDKIPNGKPWAPKWLVDLVGADYFANVTNVVLTGAGT